MRWVWGSGQWAVDSGHDLWNGYGKRNGYMSDGFKGGCIGVWKMVRWRAWMENRRGHGYGCWKNGDENSHATMHMALMSCPKQGSGGSHPLGGRRVCWYCNGTPAVTVTVAWLQSHPGISGRHHAVNWECQELHGTFKNLPYCSSMVLIHVEDSSIACTWIFPSISETQPHQHGVLSCIFPPSF